MPYGILLLIHGVQIMTAECEKSVVLDGLDLHSMSPGLARDPPLLPAALLVLGGEHSSTAVRAENLVITRPRGNDEGSVIITSMKPPNLPSFPIASGDNLTEDIAAHTAIVGGMRDETELVAGLLHTGDTKEGGILVEHLACLLAG